MTDHDLQAEQVALCERLIKHADEYEGDDLVLANDLREAEACITLLTETGCLMAAPRSVAVAQAAQADA